MKKLQRGDYVRVRMRPSDDWTEAFVAIASDSDPASVALMFGGMVRATGGLISGVLPLTIDYAAESAISLLGDSYEIEVQA